jgi:hypothetical protein
MANRRKRILLFPNKYQSIKAQRKKLPVFEPHDIRSLISEAKGKSDNFAVLRALRRRNELQMKELLERLGLDPALPDAWQRGFFFLAHYHHGVGCIGWYPRRTNRNAVTWQVDHDIALLRELMISRSEGLSERRAIKKIAADRKKRHLFPYREQKYRPSAKGTEQKRREDALRARLNKLKASARTNSILELMSGDPKEPLSGYEKALLDLDKANAVLMLVKNQQHPPT